MRHEWHDEAVKKAAQVLRDSKTVLEHSQVQYVLKVVERELPKTRGGMVMPKPEVPAYVRKEVQRFTGGLVRSTGSRRQDTSREVRKVVMSAITAGTCGLQKALEITRADRESGV